MSQEVISKLMTGLLKRENMTNFVLIVDKCHYVTYLNIFSLFNLLLMNYVPIKVMIMIKMICIYGEKLKNKLTESMITLYCRIKVFIMATRYV